MNKKLLQIIAFSGMTMIGQSLVQAQCPEGTNGIKNYPTKSNCVDGYYSGALGMRVSGCKDQADQHNLKIANCVQSVGQGIAWQCCAG